MIFINHLISKYLLLPNFVEGIMENLPKTLP